MKQYWLRGLFGLVLWAVSTCVLAQAALPDPLIELTDLSNQMIKALKADKADLKKDPQVVFDIVDRVLGRYVDTTTMSRLVLGREVWQKATPQEQQDFIQVFTLLVNKTYASGFSSYTDETVKFDPIRGGIQPGQTRVEVQSQIIRSDGPPIHVTYRLLYKEAQKEWQVYDFSVEGISMVESFRSQFADKLAQGITLNQLTQDVRNHTGQTKG